ncbi:hypothetical protein [Defluviimonas salinarum]|uniref:Uncharacterized protein n=1 Tax=Defluviimonas salinarum TaxID=2992147 RepID=A0ABT3J854_9RHOB|nr:hypothetical protein [Defluviimonas salinarum]MCW3783878.1 hypothetical protein [Defluviimonas salinarum]
MTIGTRIWVVAYNHEYNETAAAFADPRSAVIDIASQTGCSDALENGADEEFWEAVMEAYEGGWKGLSVHELDTATLEMTKRSPEDLRFTREELAEVDDRFAAGTLEP